MEWVFEEGYRVLAGNFSMSRQTPLRNRFEQVNPSTAAHYAQKFSLQRRNLEPLFEPVLTKHKQDFGQSPTYALNKPFRALSVPRSRPSPYAELGIAVPKPQDDGMGSRKRSGFNIGEDLFQIELAKPPQKPHRPRRLSPIEDRLKNEYLEQNFVRLYLGCK